MISIGKQRRFIHKGSIVFLPFFAVWLRMRNNLQRRRGLVVWVLGCRGVSLLLASLGRAPDWWGCGQRSLGRAVATTPPLESHPYTKWGRCRALRGLTNRGPTTASDAGSIARHRTRVQSSIQRKTTRMRLQTVADPGELTGARVGNCVSTVPPGRKAERAGACIPGRPLGGCRGDLLKRDSLSV